MGEGGAGEEEEEGCIEGGAIQKSQLSYGGSYNRPNAPWHSAAPGARGRDLLSSIICPTCPTPTSNPLLFTPFISGSFHPIRVGAVVLKMKMFGHSWREDIKVDLNAN